MKTLTSLIILVVVLGGGYLYFMKGGTDTSNMEETAMKESAPVSVTPISHASMVLTWGDTVIFNDPVGDAALYANAPRPRAVLVSDIHGDHYNADTLSALLDETTILIAPQAVIDQMPQPLAARATKLSNGEATIVDGITISAMPMYNVPESEDAFHTKGRGNGYLLEKDGYRVYISGDTGPIAEMKSLQNIDMAFIPMNLPYTMDVPTAAEAVLAFAPKHVYPYHYRGQDGLSDVGQFKTRVNAGNPEIDVRLLEWYPSAN